MQTIGYRARKSRTPAGLIARGDKNRDAALDSNETRDLVNAASSERTRVPFRAQPSEGLPGVIKDLKLAPERHAKALAIVSAVRRSRNVNDPTGLDAELRAVSTTRSMRTSWRRRRVCREAASSNDP